MKKQWIKTCMAVLTMGLLAFGVAGCSDGSFLGIPINDTGTPTPGPIVTILEEDVVFSVPEPFRTVEEIKASGEEVTVEEVQNAYEILSYKISCKYFEDEEAHQFITSKFISITPETFYVQEPYSQSFEDIKEYDNPFYTEFEDGRYCVDVNLEFAVGGIPLKQSVRVNLPNEFGQVLEDLGLRDRELDWQYLDTLAVPYNQGYSYAEAGNIAYKPVEITPKFIDERLAGPENAEKRERALDFFEKTFGNFEDLNRPFRPDTSQSYTE